VPVTAPLNAAEVEGDYEVNTGHAIVRRFKELDPMEAPAALVASHAPFCWGKTPAEAAHTAVILEEIAALALRTLTANPQIAAIPRYLHDKHFLRKHGTTAYYGQKK
jgi:L-ribulose-5-phosphate 4-epimerase